jgi:cytochrome c oxidase subunit I+III
LTITHEQIQTRPSESSLNGFDPMPIGKLGMWLFLASEAMFFVGLLGSFVVLESAGGQHELFVQSSAMLSKWMGLAGVVCLVLSSAMIHIQQRVVALIAAIIFVGIQYAQWHALLGNNNGPSQNNFFACYFLTTGVHCVHLIAGILPLFFFMIISKPVPGSLQIYWHFVNIVGVISFAVLYFV